MSAGLKTEVCVWSVSGSIIKELNTKQMENNMCVGSIDGSYFSVATRVLLLYIYIYIHIYIYIYIYIYICMCMCMCVCVCVC